MSSLLNNSIPIKPAYVKVNDENGLGRSTKI